MKFLKKNIYYILLFVFTFILWILIDENGPFYAFSTYADVSIYYNIGKMLTHGMELYFDLIDIKGPYMFFIGAISYLLNKSFLFFFILDLCSIMIFMFFNFKILKKYFNDKFSFIFSLFCFFIFSRFFEFFGNAECMIMSIISIFIYWILEDGFNKNNVKTFFYFGIFASFILLTKLNYLLSFGLIAVCYIINSLIKHKNILKELLTFFIGLILGCSPLIFYEIVNGRMGAYFLEYITICKKYSNQEFFLSFPLFFFFIVLFLIICLNINLFRYRDYNYFWIFIFFMGIFFSIFITKRFYIYYTYLLIPFFVFTFISFKFNTKNIILKIFIGLLLFISFFYFFKFGYMVSFKAREINKNIENNFVYSFYEDYKDEVTKDSIIFGFLQIDTGVATYFDNQPTYKYYHSCNNPFYEFDYIYLDYLKLLKNKEADFVIVSKNSDETFEIFSGMSSNEDYVFEMINTLMENYKVDNRYEYNGKIKEVYIPNFK